MSDVALVASLADIADRYDAIFCDVWGVVHNGREAFAPACDALRALKASGKPVLLLTNAPRPRDAVVRSLARLGVDKRVYDAVVTSGDSTRAEMARRAPGPVMHIGPDWDRSLYEGLDLAFATVEEAAFISCIGLTDEENETPEDYRSLLENALERSLDLVCANPDLVVRWGDRLMYCAGALAQLYEEMGGRAVYTGKPHEPIYRLACAELERVAGTPIARDRILAIGDGLGTDIAGANTAGLSALFVAGGIASDMARNGDGGLDIHRVGQILGERGLRADGVMEALR